VTAIATAVAAAATHVATEALPVVACVTTSRGSPWKASCWKPSGWKPL